MILFTSPNEWKELKNKYFGTHVSVGFVPTMGALHQGHQSLFQRAKHENELCIGSIFVNPTQFNQSEDLHNYPRTLHTDIVSASSAGCDALFVPEVNEMYRGAIKSEHSDYGLLTSSLEGSYRPGHFDGVITIVRKFLEIISPDKLYLGEKDFQQLAIVKELVRRDGHETEVVGCELIRSKDGLALSSRNTRLSDEGREKALIGYRTLIEMKQLALTHSPQVVVEKGKAAFNQKTGVELEYLTLVDEESLSELNAWKDARATRALVAFYVEGVRLIDNMRIRP